MKSEIKDGMFTSTQVSTLLGMNVQTLREWQRKDYLQLPDTGGWQRYSFTNVLSLSAMSYLLDTGLAHETAARIARFTTSIYYKYVIRTGESSDQIIPYLLVSLSPNEKPEFELIEDITKVPDALLVQVSQSKRHVTRLLIDNMAIYETMFESLNKYVRHDGSRMFWKSEGDLDQ
ncbi:MerR family transcriptional regulator [Shimia thalassica]|uniref:MerR family transcriptional regulator n=1 Tax=Shimia thalassica TaxID=1715693 RepID=UPI0026E11681|nr:MerR family transcriptional regulator [Shimia thalassica]MDO6478625.1 MerR family transcriptional regulator [Shimia thalassica]